MKKWSMFTLITLSLMVLSGVPAAGEEAEDLPDDVRLVLVNKQYALPNDWTDRIELDTASNEIEGDEREFQVEKVTLEHFNALRDELLEEGIDIELDSTYRSVERQEELWAEFEKDHGLEYCQKYVAIPGYSEHHTGLVIDVCLVKDGEVIDDNDDMIAEEEIFTRVHELLAKHGFILRYLKGKEPITGYAYEPWHFRYVGVQDAMAITDSGLTLEEYLDKVPLRDMTITVDYGSSDLYTREDMDLAVEMIDSEFSTWKGCKYNLVAYAGDECNSQENLDWLNGLEEGQDYTQCIEFLSSFHSPKEGGGVWEPDTDYDDYQWWLARKDGGDWELLTWGY